MKQFDVPDFYRSPIIGKIKSLRRDSDPRKKDFTPTLLDFGPVRFLIARHFGFCYGVENAIEISYKAIEENPDKNIYLLSQMIHNPIVNDDLISKTNKNSIFMHCLPAKVGFEVTKSVFKSSKSIVWRQAHNRMIAQKKLLQFINWN